MARNDYMKMETLDKFFTCIQERKVYEYGTDVFESLLKIVGLEKSPVLLYQIHNYYGICCYETGNFQGGIEVLDKNRKFTESLGKNTDQNLMTQFYLYLIRGQPKNDDFTPLMESLWNSERLTIYLYLAKCRLSLLEFWNHIHPGELMDNYINVNNLILEMISSMSINHKNEESHFKFLYNSYLKALSKTKYESKPILNPMIHYDESTPFMDLKKIFGKFEDDKINVSTFKS